MGADREQERGEVGEEDEGEGRRCSGARLMIEASAGLLWELCRGILMPSLLLS